MRFRYKDGGMVKINNNVLYPEEFSYKNLRYYLYAVVVHKGTCNGGHYYSFVKCDNHWFKCNDEVVTVDKKE